MVETAMGSILITVVKGNLTLLAGVCLGSIRLLFLLKFLFHLLNIHRDNIPDESTNSLEYGFPLFKLSHLQHLLSL
jgi:hypothetical protein